VTQVGCRFIVSSVYQQRQNDHLQWSSGQLTCRVALYVPACPAATYELAYFKLVSSKEFPKLDTRTFWV
jgi:hypothetical protein